MCVARGKRNWSLSNPYGGYHDDIETQYESRVHECCRLWVDGCQFWAGGRISPLIKGVSQRLI